jgi:hypothetical protein
MWIPWHEKSNALHSPSIYGAKHESGEVAELDVKMLVEKKVLWMNVAVNDALVVDTG